MPQSNLDGIKAFTATSAITRGRRVKLSSGEVVVTAAGEEGIGTTRNSADAGTSVSVVLDGRSIEMVATASITAGGNIFAAAAGGVSSTVNGKRIGIALEAASSADLLEVLVFSTLS